MSLFDAVHCLEELAAGRVPTGARLTAGALALDTLKLSGTTDRLVLDAGAGLEMLATGRKLDLDEAGRARAGEMATAVRKLAKELQPRAVTIDGDMWRRGAIEAYHGKPSAADLGMNLSYASGRVEGAAWREQGLGLNAQLAKNRMAPYKPAR